MDISPATSIGPSSAAVGEPVVNAPDQRQLLRSSRLINSSGMLGQNELVFSVDRATHRPIIRVEDRETHEVVMQLPPEYVLRLAQELDPRSTHTYTNDADT